MRATFRPLPAWPYSEQPYRPATYRVSYARTLSDLEYEIDQLGGTEVIIGLVTDESAIRLDGGLRSDARVNHYGVEVSFEVDGRRMTFHTDTHAGWHNNLRAIALGLEALRAVNRYGITTTGEQYAGFAQISAGVSLEERGRELVEQHGSVKDALRATHPDTGGDAASIRDFQAVQAYRDVGAVRA